MSKQTEYKITLVEDGLPPAKREKSKVYDDIIKKIEKSDKGVYKIEVPNKKSKSLYVVLIQRIKEAKTKDIKVHLRSDTLYLEKL